jgi:hypothetical protein
VLDVMVWSALAAWRRRSALLVLQGALREAALVEGDGLAELQPLLDAKYRAAKEEVSWFV